MAHSDEELPRQADYGLLFQSSPQPMWVFDVETLRFLAVNEAAVRRYGYSRDEFLAMTIGDIRPPEDVPALLDNLAAATPAVAVTGGWRHRKKDGTTISVEISSCPLIFEGRRAELIIPTDVTERLLLDEQLRQARKLEAIGRLAGGVAHDFNNLLTVVLGYADLALSKMSAEDPLRADLQEIHSAAERAAGLTRQLLAFSRKQVLAPQVLDVGAIVIDVSRLLRRLIGEDVELVTRIEPTAIRVKADRGQLEQVLVNLSVNARDAMPNGGRLSIEVGNVRLDDSFADHHVDVVPGDYVVVAVSDTGLGMDEETRAHLFEPFFTTKDGGTGLGLATVYGIVKQSGGSVWVYTEPGRGTVFKIYLPAVAAAVEAAPIQKQSGLHRGSETLLLLEDDANVREMVHRILRSNGYRVLPSSTGSEAERFLREAGERVSLVVSDVILPQMSGREAVARLRDIQPGLKALFISGYTDDAILRGGHLPEGVPFLEKPFTPQRLAEKVREVLDDQGGSAAGGAAVTETVAP